MPLFQDGALRIVSWNEAMRFRRADHVRRARARRSADQSAVRNDQEKVCGFVLAPTAIETS